MNQHQRMILALALCVVVVLIVPLMFPPKPQDTPAPDNKPENGKEADKGTPPEGTPPTPEETQPPTDGPSITELPGEQPPSEQPVEPVQPGEPEEPEKIINLTNEFLNVELTSKGAALKSLEITGKEGERYAIKLVDYDRYQKLSLVLRDKEKPGLDNRTWHVGDETDTRATFWCKHRGLRIEKTFDITKGDKNWEKYGVRLTLKIKNVDGDAPVPLKLSLTGAAGISLCDEAMPNVQGHICWKEGGGFEYSAEGVDHIFEYPGDEEKNTAKTKENICWTAVTNKYFVAALIPREGLPDSADALLQPTLKEGKEDVRRNSIETMIDWETQITPEERKLEFLLLATSREEDQLKEFTERGMLEIVEKGGFLSFVTVPILAVLRGIASVIPNYGAAIIILTFLIRLALFPLSRKQQVSAIKMQKIAPLMKKMKEKYKNDRKKQNEEMMKLYSKHGINPIMGCLPLLIQLPILFGLFTALRVAIDLRNASFLYINDLSVADGVSLGIKLNWSLPFNLVTFYYLNPLPIAMVVIWVLQQRLMPRSKDPQAQSQQRVMMIMPVIFFLLLYNYAAALALYITFSTLFGIIEQLIAKRLVAAEMEHSPITESVEKKKG
ncbi:MAG: membrane protein insertase YidC [Planctomycetota bacterium]